MSNGQSNIFSKGKTHEKDGVKPILQKNLNTYQTHSWINFIPINFILIFNSKPVVCN